VPGVGSSDAPGGTEAGAAAAGWGGRDIIVMAGPGEGTVGAAGAAMEGLLTGAGDEPGAGEARAGGAEEAAATRGGVAFGSPDATAVEVVGGAAAAGDEMLMPTGRGAAGFAGAPMSTASGLIRAASAGGAGAEAGTAEEAVAPKEDDEAAGNGAGD